MYAPIPPNNSLFSPAHPKYKTGENVDIYLIFKHFKFHFTVYVIHGIQSYSQKDGVAVFKSRITAHLISMFPLYKMACYVFIIYCGLQFIIAGSCSFSGISLLISQLLTMPVFVKLLIPSLSNAYENSSFNFCVSIQRDFFLGLHGI